MKPLKRNPNGQFKTPLSTNQKRTIDRAVKKTLKDYKKTLDLLAKT